MIKPNELRIGNYILTHDPKEHYGEDEVWDGVEWKNSELLQFTSKLDEVFVNEGEKNFGNNHNDVEKATCVLKPTMLRPIPLTEEWLIRFGFEREEGRWTWKKNIYNEETTLPTSLQLWSGNDFISVCRSGIGAMDCPCEYVHQLQNLYFALTGKELELKTEKQ